MHSNNRAHLFQSLTRTLRARRPKEIISATRRSSKSFCDHQTPRIYLGRGWFESAATFAIQSIVDPITHRLIYEYSVVHRYWSKII
jgi:hypothetical protein